MYSYSPMNVLMSILFGAALSGSIAGWGTVVLPSADLSRRFGAGALLVFFLTAALGWSGLLSTVSMWAVLLPGVFLFLALGRTKLPGITAVVGAAGMILLPLVLLPPSSRDALIHHLYLPRLWLSTGGVVRPGWAGFFSYPYLVETFYTVAGGTFGFRVSRMVSFIGFLASVSVAAGYVKRISGTKTAVLTVLIMLSIPEMVRNATWSYSDSFLVLFSLLAYLELLREDGNPVLAVVWAAGASCCKYNGLLVLVSVCLLLPFLFRRISRRTLLLGSVSLLFICAWWMLPNILQWGNPVYPLLRGIFGPDIATGARAVSYMKEFGFQGSSMGILDCVLLPVRVALHGQWNDPALFDGSAGPLLLAGTILALPLVRGRRRKLMLPLLYLVLAVVFRGSLQRVRYYLPGLAMLSIPATEALASLITHHRRLIRIASVMLIAGCLLWSSFRIADLYSREDPLSMPGDGEYLSGSISNHRFAMECGRFISERDTTLMVNMIRSFYFPGYSIYDESRIPLHLLEMIWSGRDAAWIHDELSGRGVDYIAMDMLMTSLNLTPVLQEDELDVWRELLTSGMVPVLTVDQFVLFRMETDGL